VLNLRGVSRALAVVLYSARLTGAKEEPAVSGLPGTKSTAGVVRIDDLD
jgi:hypothetical protein